MTARYQGVQQGDLIGGFPPDRYLALDQRKHLALKRSADDL
jgi:hypothetical protein